MARALIFADNREDLLNRFASLNEKNEVYVRHSREVLNPFLDIDYKFNTQMVNAGYNGSGRDDMLRRFVSPIGESPYPTSDIYFVNGLGGLCFPILRKLPLERSFLVTKDKRFIAEAETAGIKVLKNSPVEAIREIAISPQGEDDKVGLSILFDIFYNGTIYSSL